MPSRTQTTGATLLELLVVVVIVAISLRVGLPTMQQLLAQYRSTAAVNQVLGAVAFARNSALQFGSTTTYCPAQQLSGTWQCGPRHSWHLGSLVFKDNNANGQLDNNDQLLRRLPGWQHDARITWRAFRSRSYLQFNRRGFTNWQNGSFVYCPGNGDLTLARRIVLNSAGRSYRAHDRNGDGIDEGSRGGLLKC